MTFLHEFYNKLLMKVGDGLPCGGFTENLSNQFCHGKVLSEEKIKIPTNVHAIQVNASRHVLLILNSNWNIFRKHNTCQ